jgi:hypothetical protein
MTKHIENKFTISYHYEFENEEGLDGFDEHILGFDEQREIELKVRRIIGDGIRQNYWAGEIYFKYVPEDINFETIVHGWWQKGESVTI